MGRLKTCAIVSLVASVPLGPAQASDDIRNIPLGRFFLELRPRYNLIEESDKPLEARGYTLRAVAGWEGSLTEGVKATVEAIHAGPFAQRDFNTDPGARLGSPYPLLPDPRHDGANRVFVDFTGIEATRVRLGRQVARLENQRWVSDNDFRQIPQLFDGISVRHAGIENVALELGHFTRVRDTSGSTANLKLSLASAAWNPARGHAVSAYGVFHDQPDNTAFTGFANESYRVLGVRAEGTAARWGALEATYLAEWAQQRPYAGGDSRIDARYWRAGAGLSTPAWTVRYNHEVRGSNGGVYGLQAPLTDYYAFNGWTLHFFNAPRQGLVDRWATGRYVWRNVTLYAEAHRFRADFGGQGLGRELDVGITYEIPRIVVRLQHGRYDPGAGTPDPRIRKTWLTATLTY